MSENNNTLRKIDEQGDEDTGSASCPRNSESIIKISTIVVFIGLFFLGMGARSIADGYFYRGAYHPAAFSELQPVYGTIKKIELGRSWGISITDDSSGIKYTCGIESCGYPELVNDLNKPAKILVGNNKIYQIEVDGKITKSYAKKNARDTKQINSGIKNSLIGIAIMVAGIFIKIRNRRKN